MHLLVEDGLLLGSDYEGPSPVPVPPSVRHLSATLYDTGPNPTGDTKLAHNCTTVWVKLELLESLEFLGVTEFMISLLTPRVQQFNLVYDEQDDAITYLKVLKEHERHPLLSVVVEPTKNTSQTAADVLQGWLSKLIQRDVTVKLHSG